MGNFSYIVYITVLAYFIVRFYRYIYLLHF